MSKQYNRLEKVVILSCLYTRAKLVDLYKNRTEQLDLFGGYNSINLDSVFRIACEENTITDEVVCRAQKIIQTHENSGIYILDYFDERYPARLRTINDAPFILYVKGNLSALNKESVAIVGARDASEYGRKVAHDFSYELSKKGICIVSGLALGIDTNAHKGALDAKGYTVAVLAAAPDKIYPADNRELSERILDNNGALISEHPMGYGLYKTEFVQRNRIQSGMSKCSVIIESKPQSGSATQAEWSHKQQRQIFVVMPERFSSDNSDFSISGANFFTEKYHALTITSSDGVNTIQQYLSTIR